MTHAQELDMLARDSVRLLSDADVVLKLVDSSGAFVTATMSKTPAAGQSYNVQAVRFATQPQIVNVNGKPTRVNQTLFVVLADGLARDPRENDQVIRGAVTYFVVRSDIEVSGRQYRLTCRELG